MDSSKEVKRRRDKVSDHEDIKDRRSKKRRSRSRSRNDDRTRDSWRKRNRSRSRSPGESFKRDRRRDDAPKDVSNKPEEPTTRKAKETDMLNTRTGGAYIPPARLRMMQAQITDKSSVAYQRLAWEALKKSIHGHINKINVGNIGIIIKQLLKENIVRGRGLLCRSVIQAQAASPTFTNVYAALVSAVNSRFPNIGELLLKRLVIQFKRGFKRNDKAICISSASFIAHLVNQKVAHEIVALELLTLLVETPTDDSVEVSIAFLKECGQKLTEVSSKGVNAIFEMLRNILHEGKLDKRVQYMIEVVFQVWKDGFKDHPAVIEELELVPEEEQFTHLLMLDDATNAQDILNVFKFDDKYEENEQKYKALCGEILGSDAESGEEDGSGESGSEESEEEDEEKQKEVTIIDNTETNLVALRRTIYLTINSSLDFEECAHKLMKMQLKPGQEVELCHMFLDCCAEQRTYEKFYGLLAQRFCNINRIYISPFEEIFKDSYATAHRLDTNRLRNVSKFFAHLLFTDSISWEALDCVKLNEEDTTSSSRIYIKILFQELAEYMGLKKLNDRLKDPTLQQAFSGIFPRDNPKNSRFSINFFTSIGLGGLTDELREHLKQMPKNVPPPITEINIDSDSSSDSSSSSSSSESSSSSSDSSSSDSENENKRREKKVKKNNKNKTPKTPELEAPPKDKESDKAERWGHDGFYDTYGQDAKRNESNSGRYRNKDNNSKNRHDIRNNGEDWHRNYEQENERENSDRNRRREERRGFEDKDRPEENDRREKRLRDIDTNHSGKRRDDRESRRDRDESRSGRHEREIEKIVDRRSQEKDSRRYKDDHSKRYEREDNTSRNHEVRKEREKDNYSSNKHNADDVDRRRSDRESRRENNDRNTQHEREKPIKNRDMREEEKDKNRDKTNKTKYAEGKSNRDEMNSRKGREEQTNHSNEITKTREIRNDLGESEYISNKNNKEVLERSRNDRETRRDKDSKKNRRHENENREDDENSENEVRNRRKKAYEDDKREDNNHKHKDDKYSKSKKDKYGDKDHECDRGKESIEESQRSEESKNKKRNKNSKQNKENLQNDADSVTDHSNNDDSEDQKDLGGRYWDNFDIETKSGKDKENESFEGRTPEKNEKYYERKRER